MAKDVIERINNIEILEGKIVIDVPEGSMMPDTYFYSWGQSKGRIVRQAINAMTDYMDSIQISNNSYLKNKDEILILASIIEKETSIADERPKISAVYNNRLKKRMRLESCPSVIYGLYGRFGRELLTKDLYIKTPYNTYRKSGLPPSPICLPSRSAIMAAANPDNDKSLFFVAKSDGSHAFAADFKSHKKNRMKYQWSSN